jgi:hypothetical protein
MDIKYRLQQRIELLYRKLHEATAANCRRDLAASKQITLLRNRRDSLTAAGPLIQGRSPAPPR